MKAPQWQPSVRLTGFFSRLRRQSVPTMPHHWLISKRVSLFRRCWQLKPILNTSVKCRDSPRQQATPKPSLEEYRTQECHQPCPCSSSDNESIRRPFQLAQAPCLEGEYDWWRFLGNSSPPKSLVAKMKRFVPRRVILRIRSLHRYKG